MTRHLRLALITLFAVSMTLILCVSSTFAASMDDLTDVQKKSTYGFFVWMSENADTADEREDALIAAETLSGTLTDEHGVKVFNDGHTYASSTINVDYNGLVDNVELGQENDATSIDCLKDAVNFITLGNTYRAKENLAPLKVSSALMAMGELNVDYQGKDDPYSFGHTLVFDPLENLAMRMLERKTDYASATGMSDDPYEGWYTEEKALYDSGKESSAGHYMTMTDRKGKMLITGFGVRHRFVEGKAELEWPGDRIEIVDCVDHWKYYSQFYSTMASDTYDVCSGVTPDKYMDYIDEYIEANSCLFGKHELKVTEASEPTCVNPGNSKYYTCRNCGKFFGDEKGEKEINEDSWVIPATGIHTYGTPVVTKEPTCTEDGEKTATCTGCGAEIKSPVDKTGHDWKVTYKWADDNSSVTASAVCQNVSSHTITEEAIPSHKVTREATEELEGEELLTATFEDSAFETQTKAVEIPKLPHIHKLTLVAKADNTCEAAGHEAYYKCSGCDKIFLDENGEQETTLADLQIAASGHNWREPVYEWSSNDSKVTASRVCSNDSTHVDSETVNAVKEIIKEATEEEEGEATLTATFTNAAFETQTKTVAIPKKEPEKPVVPVDRTKQMGKDGTPTGKGASYEAADKAIIKVKDGNDPNGSKIAPLFVKSVKQGKTSVTLTWKKPSGTKKFVVYGNKCGSTTKVKKLMTTVKTTLTIKKAVKKLVKGKYYKFVIVSLDKNNNVISTSKMVHVATKGGKVGNFKSVTTRAKAKMNRVTVKKGRTFKLAGKGVPASKKLKVRTHAAVRYESTKPNVAKVTRKGVIKGLSKGTCYVYAYTQNGAFAKIRVTVK